MITLLPLSFIQRGMRLLNLKDFSSKAEATAVFESHAKPKVKEQYILRMMLRSDTLPLSIPSELKWLEPTIEKLDKLQKGHKLHAPFIYVTVRHGIVKSTTDDQWHVDGFSMRVPHTPEQNYIFTSNEPTETLVADWNIPEDFDPFQHNIHSFFTDHENCPERKPVFKTLKPNTIYAIDPYCVHRRPAVSAGTMRTFWRISFVPIEIEDDTCTPNPLFPKKIYGRQDVRKKLTRWFKSS